MSETQVCKSEARKYESKARKHESKAQKRETEKMRERFGNMRIQRYISEANKVSHLQLNLPGLYNSQVGYVKETEH